MTPMGRWLRAARFTSRSKNSSIYRRLKRAVSRVANRLQAQRLTQSQIGQGQAHVLSEGGRHIMLGAVGAQNTAASRFAAAHKEDPDDSPSAIMGTQNVDKHLAGVTCLHIRRVLALSTR